MVYDKEKEDAAFVSEDDAVSGGRPSVETVRTSRVNYSKQMHVLKSVNSKNQKTNPVAVWKLSNHRINAFAFSPDCRHLAVVSEDGSLRVIDYLREEYVLPSSVSLPLNRLTNPSQTSTHLLLLLRRLHLRLLVPRRQVHRHRRTRRSPLDLVSL